MYDLTAQLNLRDNFSSRIRSPLRSLQSFSSSANTATSSVSNLTRNLLGIAAAAVGVKTAIDGINSTIGSAMRLEQEMISMEHFIGLTQGAEMAKDATKGYVEYLRKNANLTPFSSDEVLSAGRRAINVASGDIDQAKQLLSISEDMAALNPGKSVMDAMEALADLKVGETERMKEFGFKISQDDIKAAGSAMNIINSDVKKTFEGGASKLAQSGLGLISTIKGSISSALTDMGMKAAEKLKPQLESLAAYMSGGGLAWIAEKGSDFLSGAVQRAIDFVEYIRNNWPTIKENFATLKEKIQPIKDALSAILGAAMSVASFIIANWKPVTDVVIALTAAVAAFKLGMMAMSIVGVVTNLMNAYRAGTLAATLAQYGLNTAMLLNPMTWVIAGIAALIAIGVLLYRNWDTVKAKALELWDKLKLAFFGIKAAVTVALQPVMDFFGRLKNKWDDFKNAVSNFKMPKIGMPKWLGGDGLIQSSKSHHGGLSYVPKNNYAANLHKGEAVLTKAEADDYRNNKGRGGVTVTGNTFHVRKESDIDAIAHKLALYIEGEA